jgi:hypothetical protein
MSANNHRYTNLKSVFQKKGKQIDKESFITPSPQTYNETAASREG